MEFSTNNAKESIMHLYNNSGIPQSARYLKASKMVETGFTERLKVCLLGKTRLAWLKTEFF